MGQYEQNNIFEDFIKDPSPLSRSVVELAISQKQKYDSLFPPRGFFNQVKLRLRYQEEYLRIHAFTRGYDRALPAERDTIQRIDRAWERLTVLFDFIALNNTFLIYAFFAEKHKTNPIITKEDERLLAFKRLFHGEITRQSFNESFGHYAFNAYELSARRFSEYPEQELLEIARFLSDFKTQKATSLYDFIDSKSKNLFAAYSSLREELKYLSLLVIRDLRFSFLELAAEKNIQNIFEMSYDDIKRNNDHRSFHR
ncbi:MAG TPA: hypothetical protein P5246_07800 [Candidatus Omnitrophota bacterium]|nr:hypothetical protein [Candidatus Omnitrophota bacterium]HSA31254.1 hypothetical protein [Candidatus Omnitrophota bacterium]